MMTDKLDLGSLRMAVTSLAEGVATVGDAAWLQEQTSAVRNLLLAGVIQHFEFTYDLSVKMIRRQLELEASSPVEVDQSSFRQVLRSAAERGLIEDVDSWFGYRQLREQASHAYDQARAMEVWRGIPGFLDEARRLLACLEARNG